MNPRTLPKTHLLRKNREYQKVYRSGKRLRGDCFSLIYTPNGLDTNRLGISVHGRLKGAVQRNRIKRIIKEFYRLNRELLPPSMDIVFAVRKGFAPRTPAEIREAVAPLVGDTQAAAGSGKTTPA
ncbi:MAG: ribonuclease P protein component [Desulfobacterales bacterium]|nr:ribonuclease P protein component [Desulfobacterales bacterium]